MAEITVEKIDINELVDMDDLEVTLYNKDGTTKRTVKLEEPKNLPQAPIISSHLYPGFPERSYRVLCPFCSGIHTHMGFTKGGQNDRVADCGWVTDVYDVVDRPLNEEEKDRLHSRAGIE